MGSPSGVPVVFVNILVDLFYVVFGEAILLANASFTMSGILLTFSFL